MNFDGRVYTVQIGDLTRDLPMFEVAPQIKIAIFNMLGDTEAVESAAEIIGVTAACGRGDADRPGSQSRAAGPFTISA